MAPTNYLVALSACGKVVRLFTTAFAAFRHGYVV
jgi:hypothetical protein